jgi:hypothetical protein
MVYCPEWASGFSLGFQPGFNPGLGGLFGFASISALVNALEGLVPGRLVCFFPGSRDQSSYHFMNARDGWNYHSLPITDEEGFLHP